MKLIDFLEVADDYCEVRLFDIHYCENIAKYDGRDSIPAKYNDCKVHGISAMGENFVHVVIDSKGV